MVGIGEVWEQTTATLAARARPLARVAALALVLPFAVQSAVTAYGGASRGAAALAAAVGLLALPVVVWGLLAVIGLAADPAIGAGEAGARARRRLPAALLVALVLAAAALVAAVPLLAAMAVGGYDFQAAAGHAGSAAPATLGPGVALFCFGYGLVLIGLCLWAGARLFLVNPVLVLEGRGIGALGRSVALTRGLTWKLIAVNLLFALVWAVCAFAARAVLFVVVRLLLGPDGAATAAWVGSLADAVVTAAFMVVVGVFGARLHARLPAPGRQATGPWG